MRSISPLISAAQTAFTRVPLFRAIMYRPGYPDTTVDLSPYVVSAEATMPPNFSAGYVQLTVMNPNNVITNNVLVRPDYVLTVAFGYFVEGVADFQPLGIFYVDEPQRHFVVNPPRNEVILQARDGVKLCMERHFTVFIPRNCQ